MRKYTNLIAFGASMLLVLAVYSILLFWLGDISRKTLWVGYIFTLVSAAFSCVVIGTNMKDPLSAKDKFELVPVHWFCIAYNAAAMLLGALAAANENMTFAVLGELVVMAFFMILCTAMLLKANKLSDMQNTQTENAASIRRMEGELKSIAGYAQDRILKEKILRLAEDVRFADPGINDEIAGMDADLSDRIGQLCTLVTNSDAGAEAYVSELSELLKVRNRKCKLTHQG